MGLEQTQLAGEPKGELKKQVLAWWLSQHTTAGRRWVSERLGMGDESRVTQAIRKVRQEAHPAMQDLIRQLEKVYKTPGR